MSSDCVPFLIRVLLIDVFLSDGVIPRSTEMPVCAACGTFFAANVPMLVCACEMVVYCSPDHQVGDILLLFDFARYFT